MAKKAGFWSCGRVAIIIFLAAAAAAASFASAFFSDNGNGDSILYSGGGIAREGFQWDDLHKRFLVSRMEGGVSQLVPTSDGGFKEEVVIFPVNKNATLGIRVDAPRNRLLAVVADAFGRKYSALAAYDLTSWKQLFFTEFHNPGKKLLADDVAVDAKGNAYVTDAQENFIWKVSPDGSKVTVISSPVFTSQPHRLPVFIAGLNGIEYHPDGFLLTVHTTSGSLFKVSLDGSSVEIVELVNRPLTGGDGIVLLRPNKLVVAGIPARLVESLDGWKTARVTHTYYGPFYRLLTAVAVKEGKVFANFLLGWKSFTIKQALFKAVVST